MTPEENLRDIYLQTMDIPEPYAELSPQDKTLASDLLYWFESLEKKMGRLARGYTSSQYSSANAVGQER